MSGSRWVTAGSVIALIAAIALGISIWMAKRQSDELAAQTKALQEANSALQDSVERAREETQTLDDSVKASEQYQQDQKARAVRGSRLAQGVIAAASIKTAMTEFFFSEGRWPQSNQECGVPAPRSYKTDAVQSIAVMPKGTIRLELTDDAEKTQIVWLHAAVTEAGQVTWQCVTADIPDIAQIITSCSYR